MILTCPSCSAKFMISSEALGADGREVRCGKCSHMWFQPGERDSLDELADEKILERDDFESVINRINEAADDDLDLQFGTQPFPKALQPKPEKIARISEGLKDKLRHVAAILIALAIVSVLMLGFISGREVLSNNFPVLLRSYAALGFVAPSTKPEISFDRLKINRDGTKVSGNGYVINLTSKPVILDMLAADLINGMHEVLATEKIKVPEEVLKPESSVKIEFSFDKAPENAQSVRVYTPK